MYSNIEAIDFASLYSVQRVASSYRIKDKNSWDKKAIDMNQKIHNGFYNDEVEKNINFSKEYTFLDVGCGPGTFSLRFAPYFKNVFAFDFSPKMIELLNENIKEKKIENISSFIHDMEDTWEDIPICDVVLASRCLEVENIKDILDKIDKHARKAVYLTFKLGKSYLDEELLKVIGRNIVPKPDYIYLINVLYSMGIFAELKFIYPDDSSCTNIVSEEEYLESVSWSLDGISKEEAIRVSKFYNKCIKEGKNPPLRDNRWALISWKK